LITKKQAVFFGNGLEKLEKSAGLKSDQLSNITKYLKKNSTLIVEDDLKLAELAYFKRKLKSVKLRDNSQEKLIEQLRLIKSREELENMRRAYEITAWVFAIIKKELKKKQWTEIGLARYIRIWGLELGADDVSFDPIVAAGANAAIPHHQPGDAVLKPGQSIVLDFGFKVNGYCSDFSRTVFLKRAPERLAKIYNAVQQAQDEAVRSIGAGQTGKEADAIARSYLKKQKLEKYFIHSLGHGTGLEVHEAPGVGPFSKNVLENGMVFSIEPGVYLPKLGGVRIEDLVYLQSGKPKYFFKVSNLLKDNIIK
jgi:Xaa-Pro aminopeptidase